MSKAWTSEDLFDLYVKRFLILIDLGLTFSRRHRRATYASSKLVWEIHQERYGDSPSVRLLNAHTGAEVISPSKAFMYFIEDFEIQYYTLEHGHHKGVRNHFQQSRHSSGVKVSPYSKSRANDKLDGRSSTQSGSQLNANNVAWIAQQGDVAIRGSSVSATHNIDVRADQGEIRGNNG